MSDYLLFIYSVDLMSKPWLVFYTCIATFIINLPFGYFRASYRKLSFMWFLMIHLPVPLVILIRKFHNLSLTWSLAPFLIGSFFLGQWIGKRIYKKYPFRQKKG